MILVYGGKDHEFDENLARWVFKQLGQPGRALHRGEYYAIGIAAQSLDEIAAGVVYHDFSANGKIQVSFASNNPAWAHPKIIAALLHYPFVQLGCHVLLATVRLRNKRARRLVGVLGFSERGIIPNWPDAEDEVLYALRREDAQRLWLSRLNVPMRRAA